MASSTLILCGQITDLGVVENQLAVSMQFISIEAKTNHMEAVIPQWQALQRSNGSWLRNDVTISDLRVRTKSWPEGQVQSPS
jgi:hypothetical protein